VSESRCKLLARSNDDAPIIVFVDVMLLLQTAPPRRADGKYPQTITEVARDILTMIHRRYYREGVAMIIACMDVNSTCSRVRHIAHAKRKKVQSTETQFQATERIRSPSDLLSN